MRRIGRIGVALAALAAAIPGTTQGYRPPEHSQPAPLFSTASPEEIAGHADTGTQVERDRSAAAMLAEHRRMDRALATLAPQRKGIVDAFVLAAGLDSDPVFGRETREAAAVLARRYDATSRTIVLAGTDGTGDSALPMGSPANLAMALARIAEVMDPAEDVLILYTTSHGAPFGLFYNDGDQGVGAISPARLWRQLSALGIRNRLLIIGACYSGVFVPMLSSDTTAILTASAADRTSFGCRADNDWTFFGDALINHALRKPQPLADAAREATGLIAQWEGSGALTPSDPQIAIGEGARRWLAAIEAKLPSPTPSRGRPAITALEPAK